MPTELSKFTPIAGLDGFYSATRGGLRCTAIRLQTGGLCLFSPVAGLGSIAQASLAGVGPVTYILAPNHYHNKGLVEYTQAYPDALVLAPTHCHARLHKITGLAFDGLDDLIPILPKDAQIITPQGLKTGEVWIVTPSAWLVVDAFAGPAKADGRAQLLKTFPRYGVGDAAIYTTWVNDLISRMSPEILVPCHGNIVRDPDLPAQLTTVIGQIG